MNLIRHLNNLPQINCQENEKTGRIISIDCKWYRTLLYLHKRNISIEFNYFRALSNQRQTQKCTLGSLINNKANNIALISRCLTDFDSSEMGSGGNGRPKGVDLVATNLTNVRVYTIDEDKYEFKIEPDLSQVLIEGDSLELTCRLTKKTSKQTGLTNTQIKWFLNENQQLMVSSILHNGSPTQIQIIESKMRRHQSHPHRKNDDPPATVIESKLVISNTLATQHTGKYSCAAVIESNRGLKRTPITTSRVDIKVLGRQQLDAGWDKNKWTTTPSVKTAGRGSASIAYCDEIIVQTYRGVYKWPRTVANSKLSQKCVMGRGTVNDTATIECGANATWSDHVDTHNCLFESNLTRYLHRLVESMVYKLDNLSSVYSSWDFR